LGPSVSCGDGDGDGAVSAALPVDAGEPLGSGLARSMKTGPALAVDAGVGVGTGGGVTPGVAVASGGGSSCCGPEGARGGAGADGPVAVGLGLGLGGADAGGALGAGLAWATWAADSQPDCISASAPRPSLDDGIAPAGRAPLATSVEATIAAMNLRTDTCPVATDLR
jgi:hypothetical protein